MPTNGRRTTKFQLRAKAARAGLTLETSSPGDGKTRYDFTNSGGHTVGFALGMREAEVFLRGWDEGRLAGPADTATPDTKDFVRSQESLVDGLSSVLNEAYQRWAAGTVGTAELNRFADAVVREGVYRFCKQMGNILPLGGA